MKIFRGQRDQEERTPVRHIALTACALCFASAPGMAQLFYSDFIDSAEAFSGYGDYVHASIQYDSAFHRFVGTAAVRYDAARANALAGHWRKAESDLWMAFHLGFFDGDRVEADTAFVRNGLHDLNPLIKQFKDSVELITRGFNLQYKSLVDTMHQLDYGLRIVMGAFEEAIDDNGDTSAIIKQFWRCMNITDSIAAYTLSSAIGRWGFPGNRLVGPEANKAACLILIHAPLTIQRAHAKAFRQSCENGLSPWDYYALFWDHMIGHTGSSKMKYGTTYVAMGNGDYIMEPEDPNCINHDRESVGLPPFEGYRREVCPRR
jgi:hypothetical protein